MQYKAAKVHECICQFISGECSLESGEAVKVSPLLRGQAEGLGEVSPAIGKGYHLKLDHVSHLYVRIHNGSVWDLGSCEIN